MKIPYFSLLNNCPIQINNIGSFKSPQLKDLFDSQKGFVNYGFASTIFGTTKDEMVEQFKKIQIEIPKEVSGLSKFEILISDDFNCVKIVCRIVSTSFSPIFNGEGSKVS